ncbi:MAG: DUF2974 domain-containing protein [Pirellulaceae bacterium]|nr:DUF2974 domain-containing protein [Pirellulaceae bacterium]
MLTASDLDLEFGTSGVASVEWPAADFEGSSTAVQPDGRIIVAGSVATGGSSDFAVARFHADGTIDESFGSNGRTTIDFNLRSDGANVVAIQGNGAIVVAGSSGNWNDFSMEFAIARLLPSGQLDANFGTGGKVITSVSPARDNIFGIGIQDDGKIIVSGYGHNDLANSHVALARYLPNGSLDVGFGAGGIVVTDLPGRASSFTNTILVDESGRILIGAGQRLSETNVTGYSTLRYLTDGSLDTSYGNQGVSNVTVPGGLPIGDLAAQADGKILLSGLAGGLTGSGQFALVRFNPTGQVDSTFGTNGIARHQFGTGDDFISDIEVLPDGKILAAGLIGGSTGVGIARFDANGQIDTTFDGDDGKVTSPLAVVSEPSIALQPDGKFLLAGGLGPAGQRQLAVARFLGESPDPTDQPPSFILAFKVGEAVRGVDFDASGNMLVAGQFRGTDDLDPGPGQYPVMAAGANPNGFLAKYGPRGEFLWGTTFLSSGWVSPWGVRTDEAGNSYVTGHYLDHALTIGDDVLPNHGVFDLFLAKFDPLGKLLWTISVNAAGQEVTHGLDVGPDGSVYVAGFVREGTADFNPGPGTATVSSARSDGFVAKYSSDGQFRWVRQLGGPDYDGAREVVVGPDGYVYYSGVWGSGVNSPKDLILAKLDPLNGATVWSTTHGDSSDDSNEALVVAPDGSVFTTNRLSGVSVPTVSIWKFNSAGSFVSSLSTVPLVTSVLLADDDGNLLTSGTFSGTADFDPGAGQDPRTSQGATDVFLTRLDRDGRFKWGLQFGGPGAEDIQNGAAGLARDAAGNVLLGGQFTATADFDPSPTAEFTLASGGGFVVKLGQAPPAADIAVTSSSVSDERAVHFEYTIDGTVSSFPVGIYSSPAPRFDPATARLVDVNGDGSSNSADLIVVQPVGEAGTATILLAEALPLSAEAPYILVVADPENLLPETDENNNGSNVELGFSNEYVLYEVLAREYVYEDRETCDMPCVFGYRVTHVFEEDHGFYALGLLSPTGEPLLVFRGTQPETFADWFTDFDPRGVGFGQFEAAWQSVYSWVRGQAKPATLIGHSLGGALAQWFAADLTQRFAQDAGRIGDVITFNAPGISREYADNFDSSRAGQVMHYITNGDIVSLAGRAFLPGRYTLASYSDPLLWKKHLRPVLASSASGRDRAQQVTLTTFDTVDWLNSPLFTYPDADYLATLVAAQLATATLPAIQQFAFVPPMLAFRTTTETLRQEFGAAWHTIAHYVEQFLGQGSAQASLPNDLELNPHGLLTMRISDMSLKLIDDSFRIQGTVVVPQLYSATADFSDENYIEVTTSGLQARGVLSVADIPLVPGLWELKRISVGFDTTANTLDVSAAMSIPLEIDAGANLGFVNGQFNSIELFLEELNRPILAPWPIFVQGFGGGVSHFAESDPLPPEFFGHVTLTGGPELPEFQVPAWAGGGTIGGQALAELLLTGHVDANHLGAGGVLKLADGHLGTIELNLPGTGPDRHDQEGLQLNWSESFLKANGQFNLLQGVLQGEGHLRADSRLNFVMSGSASINLPRITNVFSGVRLDLTPGVELASGNYVLSFTNDLDSLDDQGQAVNDWANDFLALWTEINVPQWLGGPVLFGYRVGFDGRITRLGWEELPEVVAASGGGEGETLMPTARYHVGAGTPQVLLSAVWSPASPETRILIHTPGGETLTEEDLAQRGDMAIVPDLSDPSGRVVVIDDPQPGVWSISVVNVMNLEQVEFNGLGGLVAPTISVDAVGGLWGAPVDVRFEAHDTDSEATIHLYYDHDQQGADGVLIASGLKEADGSGAYSWDAGAIEPGEYFLYAMIEDGENPPAIVYANRPVTVGSPPIDLAGPTTGVPGEPLALAVDVDLAGPLVFGFDWTGDGVIDESFTSVAGYQTGIHAFDSPGAYEVRVTVTEPESGAASSASWQVVISQFELRGDDLVVGGDAGHNRIVLTLSNNGGLRLRLDHQTLGPFDVAGQVVVYGHGGDDTITVAGNVGRTVEFHGGPGDDYLAGGPGDDSLFGGPGNDRLLGGEGDNFLDGGAEDDRLWGRDGADVLLGGSGNDHLYGGNGPNLLDGGTGDDVLAGGLDDDVLVGGDGDDNLSGYFGHDILVGGWGDDQLFGHAGNDVLLGGPGRDWLRGDQGDDLLVAQRTIRDQVSASDALTAATLGQALRDVLDQWQAGRFDLAELAGDDLELDDLLGADGADWFHADASDLLRDLQSGDRLN